jgi:spore maturation protein CgeB
MNRIERFFSVYRMNHMLERTIIQGRFDLLFFLKPDVVKPWVLRSIRPYAQRIISFYPENPFVLWNGNSNADVLAALPLFDEHLTWSLGLIDPLYAAGAKSVSYFPFGFDARVLVPAVKKRVYTFDACFMGTWEPDRAWWLEELVKRMPQLRLGIWGNLWEENIPQESPLRFFLQGAACYGHDMAEIFRSSAITLNFIRQQNRGSHNMRTLEVPACGAFLLTERTHEQAKYLFTENESLACFATPEELEAKIRYFLDNPDKRELIALNGFEHVQQYELTKLLEKLLGDEKHHDAKTKDCQFIASSL